MQVKPAAAYLTLINNILHGYIQKTLPAKNQARGFKDLPCFVFAKFFIWPARDKINSLYLKNIYGKNDTSDINDTDVI